MIHYMELKDDKHFMSWNRSFVATVFMHHTQHVVDGGYKPAIATELGLFRGMQFLCILSLMTSSRLTKAIRCLATKKLHVMRNEYTRNLPSIP
jgi:hypothetical protein